MKFDPVNLKWIQLQHGHDRVCERLDEILESWKDTPYALNQACKKVAVDCVKFVFSVLNELYVFVKGELVRLPADTAFHQKDTCIAAVRQLMETYSPCSFVQGLYVEPGDIIMTGTKGGSPGHAMIAGTKQSELWHCSPPGVCKTEISFCDDLGLYTFHKIIRAEDKHLWVF